jgi:hypothetical protein
MIRLGRCGICVLVPGRVFRLITGMFCDVRFGYVTGDQCSIYCYHVGDICVRMYMLTDITSFS